MPLPVAGIDYLKFRVRSRALSVDCMGLPTTDL